MVFHFRSSLPPPLKAAGGDRAPKSAGWRGKASSAAMKQRTLITTRARRLRKAMSSPEVMLWVRLRGRRPEQPTFRRQHPMGSIILDFYCPSARLAVEIDGSTHWDEEAQGRDRMRDRWLQGQGVTVVRIDAAAVYRDPDAVAEAILRQAQEMRPSR